MTCPTESELIRWIAGELDRHEAASVETHVSACPACRDQAESLRATWSVMDAWQVDASGRDRTADVLSRLDQELVEVPAGSRWSLLRWSTPIRAAACFMLAAALGWGAAQLWPEPTQTQLVDSSETQAPVSGEAVAEVLGLEALNGGTPVGMAASLLEPEEDPAESVEPPAAQEDRR